MRNPNSVKTTSTHRTMMYEGLQDLCNIKIALVERYIRAVDAYVAKIR